MNAFSSVGGFDPHTKRTADIVELMAKQGRQVFVLQLLTLLVASGSLVVSLIALKIVS